MMLKYIVKSSHYLCCLLGLCPKIFVHDPLLLVVSLLLRLSGISAGRQVQCKVDNGLLKGPILDFLLGPF